MRSHHRQRARTLRLAALHHALWLVALTCFKIGCKDNEKNTLSDRMSQMPGVWGFEKVYPFNSNCRVSTCTSCVERLVFKNM